MSLQAAQNQSATPAGTPPSDSSKALYGGKSNRRVTVHDIAAATARGEKWPMLTAYDAMTASVFDEAGIPVMLVGDSMGNCHLATRPPCPSRWTRSPFCPPPSSGALSGP